MRVATQRYVVLIGLLLLAAVVAPPLSTPREVGPTRWPADGDAFYSVVGWSVGPSKIDLAFEHRQVSSRQFWRADGTTAQLFIAASPLAKQIYRADADVPIRGAGFEIEPVAAGLAPRVPGGGTLVARRGRETALVVYAYGQRGGLLGNGLTGWISVGLDTVLGRPNDYFLATLFAPVETLDSEGSREVIELAQVLFPRLASWYAAPETAS